ncbi:hypothetical protein ARMGADRAFT_1068717 [Armillaria gallica]|uniref:Uncharacterized protein n=1 Tax=Armillaria gallica TaxID=47427 RepID=A0A2H3CVZ7_ARMGA|nr:hypothetical protein ARMGADRAFT_1068717 [Armillaria gallica]
MSDETMDFGSRTHETFQHLGVKSSAYVLQAGPVPRTAKVTFPDRGPPQDDGRSRIWNTFARNLEERRVSSLHASLAVRDFLLRRPDACVGRKVATCYPKSSVVLSEGDEVAPRGRVELSARDQCGDSQLGRKGSDTWLTRGQHTFIWILASQQRHHARAQEGMSCWTFEHHQTGLGYAALKNGIKRSMDGWEKEARFV